MNHWDEVMQVKKTYREGSKRYIDIRDRQRREDGLESDLVGKRQRAIRKQAINSKRGTRETAWGAERCLH